VGHVEVGDLKQRHRDDTNLSRICIHGERLLKEETESSIGEVTLGVLGILGDDVERLQLQKKMLACHCKSASSGLQSPAQERRQMPNNLHESCHRQTSLAAWMLPLVIVPFVSSMALVFSTDVSSPNCL